MKQKVLKIIEIILTVIMSIVIAILLLFIGQRLIFKDKPAQLFGIYAMEVISDSMTKEGDPNCIRKGDMVIVWKNKTYEEGMVISYLTEGETIPTTHMITKIDGENITTKGINDTSGGDSEETFNIKYVLGEVKFVVRNFATIQATLTNPGVIIGVVLLGGGGIFLLNYFGKSPDEEENKEKQQEK
jgi:signal peptidase I